MIELTGNERFVWDSYRRFMQMFGDVVLDIPHHDFEVALEGVKKKRKAKLDTDLCVEGLREVVDAYKKVYKKNKKAFPQKSWTPQGQKFQDAFRRSDRTGAPGAT